MAEMTASTGLPAQHGVERAAARVHRACAPKQQWSEITAGSQQFYRSTVGHLLRDLGPAPEELRSIPLLWFSPTWGVLQAERSDWMQRGKRLVVPIRVNPDMVIELPDDAIPMAPIQSCRPGKSLDDIRGATMSSLPEGQAA
jgi:hypothetical protein